MGVLREKDEDLRSLKELIVYGLKGMAAYLEHAMRLGHDDESIHRFMQHTLAQTATGNLSAAEWTALALKTGEVGVQTMALLDRANTTAYGHPEMTSVDIGVRHRPGILISGHDLHDLEELLEQTRDTGIDIYTHGEMLPAHYYPAFKKYPHFAGNYGNAWWKQREEFASFNGPILFTTNCIVPPLHNAEYKSRMFTTNATGFPGCKHIGNGTDGHKDYSEIIEMAKTCQPPTEIEHGTIVGGFAHNQVLQLADKVVEAVKSGAIRKFIVMAGCDGRMRGRDYYTAFAESLPKDTVILTAGCAKYRYNKLPLGDINGIPRVLDAGQCNDSYSLAVIAPQTERGVRTAGPQRTAHRLQHRLVRTEGRHRLAGPAQPGGEGHPPGTYPPGLPLPERGESAGRELRHQRHRNRGRRLGEIRIKERIRKRK